MQLSQDQFTQWREKGWIVLRGALDDAPLRALERAVEEVEAWSRQGSPGMHHFESTPDGPRLARSEDFDPHHPALSRFLREGLLPEILHQLFGEPAVLFKEKINFKYPGGGGFAPHQDAPAYRFVDHHISCMVSIDPATIENGCLWFAPGHREGILPNVDGRIDRAWLDAARWEPIEADPGDLVFFDSYAPHKSDTNRSTMPRRLMYLTYNAASQGDLRERYYADKRSTLALDGERGRSGHVRMSINDDFLGKPVPAPRRES
jgi:ectoine hydroxylase-related dioxygenase (phytanoyl-CoA dioxygenase family)